MTPLRFRCWYRGKMYFGVEVRSYEDGSCGVSSLWEGGQTFGPDEEHATLMQSTGLKDKNGKEIFEGDIVEDQEGAGTVVWVPATAAFCIAVEGFPHHVYGFNKLDTSRSTQLQETQVIGNVWANPELLSVSSS